ASSASAGSTCPGGGKDPDRWVALSLLLLLRAATAPDDERLDGLACAALVELAGESESVRGRLDNSMRGALWFDLIGRFLAPLGGARRDVGALLRRLGC